MDANRFDALLRSLSATPSRRATLCLLAVAALGGTFGALRDRPGVDEATADRRDGTGSSPTRGRQRQRLGDEGRHGQRKKRKKRRKRAVAPPPPPSPPPPPTPPPATPVPGWELDIIAEGDG